MKKWFLDLPVKRKLLLSFLLVALIGMIVGYTGYLGLDSLKDTIDHTANQKVPAMRCAGEMATRFNAMIVGERGLINHDFLESSIRQAQFKYIEDNLKLFEAAWKEYEVIPRSAEEDKNWQALVTSYNEWKVKDGTVMSLSREKDRMMAGGLGIESAEMKAFDAKVLSAYFASRPPSLVVFKSLNELLEINKKEITRLQLQAQSDASSASSVLLVFIAIGFFAAIGFGLFIANVITKPITQVVEMTKEVCKGHVKARANVEQKDEIGFMAQNVDKIASQLEALAGAMDAISGGDVSITVPAYDNDDELANALNRITATLRDLTSETEGLIQAAIQGRLNHRGNVNKFNGGYRNLIDGINRTLDAVINPIKEGADILSVLATGDLMARVEGQYSGDHQMIKDSINQVAESLSNTLNRVNEAVAATASAATQISSSCEELAAGTQEQSSQTTEIAGAIEEMTKTILETSQNAAAAAEQSKVASMSAQNGAVKIEETKKGMERIVSSSKITGKIISSLAEKTDQIGEITQVIDDIADQTNLLALNAAIEAARAGEQGRGFAVVADEVRKLAERTTKATKEIAVTIKNVQKEAKEADQSMAEAGESVRQGMMLTEEITKVLSDILEVNLTVSDLINQVAVASEEQSSAAEQISKNIENISNVTNETASGTTEIARAAEDLNRLTDNLQNLIGAFKLEQESGYYNNSRKLPEKRNMKMIGRR